MSKARAAVAVGGLFSAEAIQLRKCQKLTRRHLGRRAAALFHELIGRPFHVAWAPAWPRRWTAETLPTGSVLCRQVTKAHTPPACCRRCAARRLARTLASGPAGHRFACPRGVRNLWLPIRVLGLTVGLAFVQARDGLSPFQRRGAGASPATSGAGRPQAAAPPTGHKAKWFHRRQLDRAARLLRLVVHHAEAAGLASLREADLAALRHVIVEHESEEARLRQELGCRLPGVSEQPAAPEAVTHFDQIVRWILDRIHEHSPKPITMQFCADSLGLHPSYLSTLFSRKVGLPFRRYMGELRLEQARQLLGDPVNHLAEVAAAVGYASENSFRLAFKKATGLSPTAWRDSLRARGR